MGVVNKGSLVKFMLMSLGYFGAFMLVAGAPSGPTPSFPFGKPADLGLLGIGTVMVFVAVFGIIYIYIWRRAMAGADYIWIGAIIRDLRGNWRDVLWAVPKSFEAKTLKAVEKRLIEASPEIAETVRMFEAELREKFIWQKIPVIAYTEDGERYEGFVVIGMTDTLLANIGEGGLRKIPIDVDGFPLIVEYAPLEFLELGTVRISEIEPAYQGKNPFKRLRQRMSQRVESYGGEPAPLEEYSESEEAPFFYRIKKVPCLLLIGSPLMYQKLALLGLNLLQLFPNKEEAVQQLIEVQKEAYSQYVNNLKVDLQLRDTHLEEMRRALQRHVDFSIGVSPQRIYEMTPAQAAFERSKKWIIAIILLVFGLILAFGFLSKLGLIGGVP
jgi:hypothetical protein